MFDDYDDEDDDSPLDNMIVLGFQSVDGLVAFIEWVTDTFDDPDDLRDWVEANVATTFDLTVGSGSLHPSTSHPFVCSSCDASYSTSAGLSLHRRVAHSDEDKNDPFWGIINNSFTNHKEGPHDKLRGSD